VNVTSLDEAFTGFSHPQAKLSPASGVYYSMRSRSTEEPQMTKKYDESRIADEIVSVLPAGVARACSSDRNTLRYAVRAAGMKLQSIVLNRRSLRNLIDDPARDVKIEYLQRELVQSAALRTEFAYPRPHVAPGFHAKRNLAFGLPMVSLA
jgi:hypothetical protein